MTQSAPSPSSDAAGDTIEGTVFRDNNANGSVDGTLEPGVGGVGVVVYNAAGTQVGAASTDTTGRYTITTSAAGPYRVEFSTVPNGLYDGAFGAASATSIQFVADGGSSAVDFGISSPAAYCQDVPDVVTNLYFQDAAVAGRPTGDSISLVDFPYSAINNNYVLRKLTIPQASIGTTWGLAYRRSTRMLYSAAYFKRYTPIGPNGNGAIYQIDRTSNSASLFADLNALFGAETAGPDMHGFAVARDYIESAGAITNTFDATGKVGLGDIDLSDDESKLYAVNLFDRQLYELPLTITPTVDNIRRVPVPLDQATLPTHPCPNPNESIRPFGLKFFEGSLYVGMVCNGAGAPDTGEQASWADSNNDRLYNINENYNDANGNRQFDYDNPDGLFAYVYRVNPTTLVFEPTPVVSINLAFDRGEVNGRVGPGDWAPWAKIPTARLNNASLTYPQPILSDIEFDNGNMILGLRDRFGDQSGERVEFFENNTTLYRAQTGGDILRACGNPTSGWTLENNGICGGVTGFGKDNIQGPGGGEFYQDVFEQILVGDSDGIPNHQEITVGGLAVNGAKNEVISTAYDAAAFYSQGVRWFNNTGREAKSYTVLIDPGIGFGKSAGIGDVELLCDPAPIEIGNRVWKDSNANGIQDAGEPPLEGVIVNLFNASGVLTGTAVTNANGEYYFKQRGNLGIDDNTGDPIGYVRGGIQPNTQFQIRLDNPNNSIAPNKPLFGLNLTQPNRTGILGASDLTDSDAQIISSTAGTTGLWPTIVFTTSNAGVNNHAFDFGFSEELNVSIGNQVWYDFDNDKEIDPTETGVAGVVVNLFHDANGNGLLDGLEQTPISTTRTVTDGFYLFTRGISEPLATGIYAVGISRTNFITGGVLEGYHSSGARMTINASISEPASPDPDNNIDNDDNGEKENSAFYIGGILSKLADVTTSEPIQEASSNAQGTTNAGSTPRQSDPNLDTTSNLTVDFGFYQAGVGNRLILDLNNNENREFLLEAGLDNVTVTLWTANGITPVNIGVDGILGTSDDAGGNASRSRFDGFTGGLYELKGLPEGEYLVKLIPPFTDQIRAGNDFPGMPVRRLISSNKNLPDAEQQVDPDVVYRNNDDNGFPDPSDPTNLVTSLPILITATVGAENTPNRGITLNTFDDFMLTIPISGERYSVGNRVFADLNNNGVWNPGVENGIAGAIVRLYQASAPNTIAVTRTTDSVGFYRFDNIPTGDYFVEVVSPAGYESSSNGPGTNNGVASSNDPDNNSDTLDDGVLLRVSGGITLVRSLNITIGPGASEVITETDVPIDVLDPHGSPNGQSNLTVDFGFFLAQPLSLGNVVWDDANNNGLLDSASEQGIANVEVAIYIDSNGDRFIGGDERVTAYLTTTTTITGYYLFSGLPPATYQVELTADNFKAGRSLEGYKTSTGRIASPTGPAENGTLDPDLDVGDQQDKGIAAINTIGEPVIRTRTLDLSKGGEPLGEVPNNDLPGHPDADANLTVDFGVYRPFSLGNRVWLDVDNNSKQDDGYIDWEQNPIPLGVGKVVLRLYTDTLSSNSIATTTTDLNGYYRFDNLVAGEYVVEVMVSNFISNGPLTVPTEFVLIAGNPDFSSPDIASTADPDDPIDLEDNGIGGTHDPIHGIRSGLITLEAAGNEPTAEADLSPSGQGTSDRFANMTVDFGFSEPVLIGNQIWYDRYADGKTGSGSTGVPNLDVRVFLDANNDNMADSSTPFSITNTGANGFYTFFLTPGNWLVEFDLPEGFASSSGNFGYTEGTYEGAALADPDDPIEAGGNLDGVDTGSLVPGTRIVRSKSLTVLPRTEIIEDVLNTNLNAYMGIDFGIYRPMSIGNLVWEDSNNNGTVDASEVGIPGVFVNLYSDDDQDGIVEDYEFQRPLLSTTTNAQGFYIFTNLPSELDYVVELAPSNFTPGAVLADARSSVGAPLADLGPVEPAPAPNDDRNSDDNGSERRNAAGQRVIRSSELTLLAEGATGLGLEATDDEDVDDGLDNGQRDSDSNVTVDFGVWRPFSIGNRVWLDMNNNGAIDSDEPGIRGVQVELYMITDTVPLDSRVTDANGYYRFDGLQAGDYFVVLPNINITVTDEANGSLVGLRSSTPDETDPNNNRDSNDNGAGMTINALLGVRSGVVTLGPASDEPLGESDLADGGQGSGDPRANMTVDFGFYRPLALGDKLWFDANNNGLQEVDEAPIPGVQLVLSKADAAGNPLVPVMSTTSGISGCYLFTDVAPIDYVVQIPASELGADGKVAGYVASDVRDSSPISNALNDNTGAAVNGAGILSAKVALTYTAQPIAESTCASAADVADNNSNQTVDIGLYQLQLGNQVWVETDANGQHDPSDVGLDGVTIELLDAQNKVIRTTQSANGGFYTFTGLISGSYSVRIQAPPAYVSCSIDGDDPNGNLDHDDNGIGNSGGTIPSQPIALSVGNETRMELATATTLNDSLDFCLNQLASLGDYTWLDVNGNGVQEDGETPLSGISVTLFHNGAVVSTTITNDKGFYLFDRLPARAYSLSFTSPYTYVLTRQDAGSVEANDSDVDPFIQTTLSTELAPGEKDMTWDGGYTFPASLGRYVWFDNDRDGIFDPNEPPLAFITVTLLITRKGQATALRSLQTDVRGEFLFAGLPPGDYQLTFVAVGEAEFTTPGSDSDANPTTGGTALVSLAAGEYKELGAGYIRVGRAHLPTALGESDEPTVKQTLFLPLVSR